MARREYFRLVQAYRDLVVVREVPAPALEAIDRSKVYEVLPAIVKGDVSVEEALDDARSLGFRDLRQQYRQLGAGSKQLEASKEPARVKCPVCDQWTTEEVIDGTGRRQS